MMEPNEIVNGCKYAKTCHKADARCISDSIQKSCPGYTMFEIESLRAENEHLQAELETSQRRERAAVECLEKIYERTRPDGLEGGYPYGATTCIGSDVYHIVEQWRGPEQEGEETDV